MSETTQTPAATLPATPPLPDVTAHLAALADAMRRLAESQKTLIETVKPVTAQPAPPAARAAPANTDIGGDPAGGASPGALGAIDYSKLSPLQQITLGLRNATTPATPRAPASGAD